MTDAMKLGETLWVMHLEHMRALDQIVEKSCIRGENGVLMYLYHVGHPMFPGELTEKLGLTTGRVANILRELEHTGLIVRTPDVKDKRRVRVALTPAGEARAIEQNHSSVSFHERLLSQLDPEEAARFLDTMTRLGEIIDRGIDQPGP